MRKSEIKLKGKFRISKKQLTILVIVKKIKSASVFFLPAVTIKFNIQTATIFWG